MEAWMRGSGSAGESLIVRIKEGFLEKEKYDLRVLKEESEFSR